MTCSKQPAWRVAALLASAKSFIPCFLIWACALIPVGALEVSAELCSACKGGMHPKLENEFCISIGPELVNNYALGMALVWIFTLGLCMLPVVSITTGFARSWQQHRNGAHHMSPARKVGRRRLSIRCRKTFTSRKHARWKQRGLWCFFVVLWLYFSTFVNLDHVTHWVANYACRFGEASHPGPPGPDLLQIGLINPTSLAGKLDSLHGLGHGVWALSETSATQQMQDIAKKFFRKEGKFVQFSRPVRPHKQGLSRLRGVAQGVGVLSSFKQWESLQKPPVELVMSSRFRATMVQVSCNCVIQVISLYGPHHTSMVHPHAFTDKMLRFSLEFAANYKGPSIICGDLNKDIEELPTWNLLKQCGFVDLAAYHAAKCGTQPSPTCRDSTRYMYMLASASLKDALVECDTREDHLFDSHPVLAATFRKATLLAPRTRIWYPKSFDNCVIDHDTACRHANEKADWLRQSIQQALQQNDINKAATDWTKTAEDVLHGSACDVEGNAVLLSKGYLGRASGKLVSHTPASIPLCKKGRDADYEPEGPAHSVPLRQKLRQVRRLQSLVRQLKSQEKLEQPRPSVQWKCHQLWKSILCSTGYVGGFPAWLFTQGAKYIPLECPTSQEAQEIFASTDASYRKEERAFLGEQRRKRQKDVREDFKLGGKLAYGMIRDATADVPSAFHVPVVARKSEFVARMGWILQCQFFTMTSALAFNALSVTKSH